MPGKTSAAQQRRIDLQAPLSFAAALLFTLLAAMPMSVAGAENGDQLLSGNTLSSNQLSSASNSGGAFGEAQEFLHVDEAFQLNSSIDEGVATLVWTIAPDYYLYQHAFAVAAVNTAAEITAAQGESTAEVIDLTASVEFSQGIRKMDDYFGPVEVYYYQAVAKLPLSALPDAVQENAAATVKLAVKYQGCAEAGLCYPVQQAQVALAADPAIVEPNSLEAALPENLPE